MFQRSTILIGNQKLCLITLSNELSVLPFSNLIIFYLGFFKKEKMEETVRVNNCPVKIMTIYSILFRINVEWVPL